MVALLLYAYTQRVYASRRIAKACKERLDVMAVTGMQRPDFRTISDFGKRHLKALTALFVQVLRLCRKAGLVKLGHVRSTAPSSRPTRASTSDELRPDGAGRDRTCG